MKRRISREDYERRMQAARLPRPEPERCVDVEQAKGIWAEYQQQHDISDRKGQIAGIDPPTGRVWIGEWFDDVIAQRNADGIERPLFFEKVGYPTVFRKLRCSRRPVAGATNLS